MSSATFVICASGDAQAQWRVAIEAISPPPQVVICDDPSACARSSETVAAAIIDLAEFPMSRNPTIDRFTELFSPAPVIVSTASFPTGGIDVARARGIAACIPRYYSDLQRRLAITLVLSGVGHYPLEYPERLVVEPAGQGVDRTSTSRFRGFASLTPRQRDIAVWIVRGSSNKEIARHLCISEQVVRNHVTEMYKRLNVRNRASAAAALRRMDELRQRLQSLRTGERDVLHWMKSHLRSVDLDAGDVLFRKGDEGKDLYYIRTGTILLDEIQEEMGPRELFGEIAAFTSEHRRTCTARAKTSASLYRLDHDHAQRIFFDHPEFAQHVMSVLAKRVASGRGM